LLQLSIFAKSYSNNNKNNKIFHATMDATDLSDLLEELGDNIDDLETALEPLLSQPIAALSSKLSPLEKAKLYTWLTYAIEAILFSHIRLNGTEDPKSHPIFTELRRVQQYMQKVQEAENPVGKRENLSLNKAAAGRFIKAGLSGNDKYDQ
jgi:exosome complex protein LRP1